MLPCQRRYILLPVGHAPFRWLESIIDAASIWLTYHGALPQGWKIGVEHIPFYICGRLWSTTSHQHCFLCSEKSDERLLEDVQCPMHPALHWNLEMINKMAELQWHSRACHHFLSKWFISRVIHDRGIEAVARNKTFLVLFGLFCKTGLFFRATVGDILQNYFLSRYRLLPC